MNATEIDLASFQGTNTDNQVLELAGTDLSISGGNTIDVSSLQDGVDDADNNPLNEIQSLILDGDTLEISNGNRVILPYDSSYWVNNNNTLYYNEGKVGIGTLTPNSKLEVQADASFSATDTLFAVKDKDGNVVFAVFPDGAKVYVNKTAKGAVSGFSVSGRQPGKAIEENFLHVTSDSTKISFNKSAKGAVSGFSVSGRQPGKAIGEDLFIVTPDSTQISFNNTSKGAVSGFSVSGRQPGKSGVNDYFNVSGAGSTGLEVIKTSEPRMLWYPRKEAFLVGRVLIEHPDSVGLNSIATGFESKAMGDYSQAFGNQAMPEKTIQQQ